MKEWSVSLASRPTRRSPGCSTQVGRFPVETILLGIENGAAAANEQQEKTGKREIGENE